MLLPDAEKNAQVIIKKSSTTQIKTNMLYTNSQYVQQKANLTNQ